MAGTITDIAAEPVFVTERFGPAGDRLEITGHWRGLRGRRFVRPVLWLHDGDSRRRLVAVLDHKPWAAEDGEPWIAAFPWPGGRLRADRAELEVGRELVVELPVPGAKKAPGEEPRPARRRQPTEADRLRAELDRAREAAAETERLRAELTAAREESNGARAEAATARNELERLRAELAAARDELDRARAAAARPDGDVERLRAELAAARADADRARADGERLVNDEYEQRRRALEAAEAATRRAREAEEARDLAQRQLNAARDSHAELEARLSDATVEVAPTDDRLAAEAERLGRQLEAARQERDHAREELVAARKPIADLESERDRLGRRLAAAEEQREHLRSRLAATEAERDGLRAEVAVTAHAEVAPATPARRPLTGPTSPIGPPRSGPGLWAVRLLALALVAILLIAAAVVLAGVL